MRYRLLGRSGLRVSELCLGTMTFGETGSGWSAEEPESRAMFDTYVDAGGNFIDTANVYSYGVSEEYLANFIGEDRDRFVLATKYTLKMRDDPNYAGNHRKNLKRSIVESLDRLNTDHVDLLWMHAWDQITPIDDVMRALNDLVELGIVHHIGASDTPAWVVAQANTLADQHGWAPFVAYQGQWNLASRGIEDDVLPMCRALNLAVTPWGCLGGGVLTGKYGSKRQEGEDRRRDVSGWKVTEHEVHMGDEVAAVADEIGCSAAQVALAWVRGFGKDVIPILGARNAEQLADNLAVVDIELTSEHRARLEEASGYKPGFPHSFINRVANGPMGLGVERDEYDL